MSKKLLRLISMMLVVAMLFAIATTVSAFGPTNRKSTSTISVVTCGDKLFGKTTKITIKNTSSDPIIVTAPTSISNCSWSRGTGFHAYQNQTTIYKNGWANFVLRTKFGKAGVMKFQIKNAYGDGRAYTAQITGSNYYSMAVVG